MVNYLPSPSCHATYWTAKNYKVLFASPSIRTEIIVKGKLSVL